MSITTSHYSAISSGFQQACLFTVDKIICVHQMESARVKR